MKGKVASCGNLSVQVASFFHTLCMLSSTTNSWITILHQPGIAELVGVPSGMIPQLHDPAFIQIKSPYFLVGGPGPPRPEKSAFVHWEFWQPNMNGKIKLMATKPPTSFVWGWCFLVVGVQCSSKWKNHRDDSSMKRNMRPTVGTELAPYTREIFVLKKVKREKWW